jgi:integrase/recombinase XerD
MSKIQMKTANTVQETFDRFILVKKAAGLADKTLESYQQHFHAISKYIDPAADIAAIDKEYFNAAISAMRERGLKPNSLRSYTRTIKSFLSWCNVEEITAVNIPLFKAEDTVKETYTDKELEILLKKPNMKTCKFAEFRNWVIINFLMNSGCRASTVRNIQMRDVDFENNVVHFRHTKNKKAQIIPLCRMMCQILVEYMKIRGGEPDEYLFPNDRGEQLTENALRCSISKYNKRRGVATTSIHSFRHTFARKYLLDCGGNAFTLQKLLGHSTLDMTKHYCAVFNADIVKNYDNLSPLAQLSQSKSKIPMR